MSGGTGGSVSATTAQAGMTGSAGRASTAGGAAGAGAVAMAGPAEPKIPPIMGECPMFASGTATIGGLRGITVQVGPMKSEKGPLLFYWHGTGQTASMVNSSVPNDVRDEILAAGGIIISPSGSLGTGGDCSGTGTFYKDDFKVADLIVACGVRDHNIDPRRIYTTGCSAGGLHAGCMANMRASYLAAAAPNSGGIIGMQPKDDPHVPALFTMHGGPGDVVIVTFSETSKTLYTAFAAMGGTVVNCNHGGGHCGAPAALEKAAWQFMKDNPFGAPSPYTNGLPASFPKYCEIIK
jgi:poly(3-hydroxybutyrate) depolymerase